VDELLRRATHLTKAETKELAVSIRPKQVPADGLRRLPAPAPRPAYPSPLPASAPGGPSPVMVLRIPAPTGQAVVVAQPLARSIIEPVAKDRWQWRVGLEGERKAKLDTLRGYLGHKIPDGDPANVTGSSTVDDLTTKCRAHNLYRAMLRYGIDYVLRRIEEARREREARRSAKAASNPPTLCEPVAPWGAGGSAAVA